MLGTATLGADFEVVDWAAVPTDKLHAVGVKPEARADGSTGLGVAD